MLRKFAVGRQDVAGEIELDHPHGAVDGLDAALPFVAAGLLLGHVGRDLHDLAGPARRIEDRVCRSPGSKPRDRLCRGACTRRRDAPRSPACARIRDNRPWRRGRIDEQGVVAPHHLVQTIAHRLQEIALALRIVAVEGELDHRLRRSTASTRPSASDRACRSAVTSVAKLHDADRAASAVDDRIEDGLQPDLGARLGPQPETLDAPFAGSQPGPQTRVAVTAAAQMAWFRPRISESVQPDMARKPVVGVEDGPVEIVFHHGLALIDRGPERVPPSIDIRPCFVFRPPQLPKRRFMSVSRSCSPDAAVTRPREDYAQPK